MAKKSIELGPRDFAKVRESATGALSTFLPGLVTTCTVTRSTELGIFVDVQVRKIKNFKVHVTERIIFMILLFDISRDYISRE